MIQYPFSVIYLKEIKSIFLRKLLHSHVYFSIILFRQHIESSYIPINNEFINNHLCMHTTEYYSVFENKEILPFATKLIDLEEKCIK